MKYSLVLFVIAKAIKIPTFLERLICLVVCLYSYCVFAYGQVQESEEIYEIEIRSDSIVQVGKPIRLTYTYSTADPSVSVSFPKVQWDEDACCDVLAGPTRSYHEIDGDVKKTYEYTFTYIVVFNRECVFNVPRMELQTGKGKVSVSAPFTIHVVSSVQIPEIKKNLELSEDEFVVLETSVNKTHLILGDSVECEIRLYANVRAYRMASKNELLIDNAFWHDLKRIDSLFVEKAIYKGKPCSSVLWKKLSIIPLQEGEIHIKPMQFIATIIKEDPNVDPFEAFFNGEGGYIEKDTVLSTQPLVIHVDKRQIPKRDLSFSQFETPHKYGLVIDRSSSLRAQEDSLSVSFSELENQFIDEFRKDGLIQNASVTVFAGRPYFPSEKEIQEIHCLFPSKENDGSAVYDAILASALRGKAFSKDCTPSSVLLLTDGSDNKSHISAETMKNLLLRYKVRVDVIAFASKKDSVYYNFGDSIGVYKIANEQDLTWVEMISRATNGFFMSIANKEQFPFAIRKIKESLINGRTPILSPDEGFDPNPALLYILFEEILTEARTQFTKK